MKKLTCLFLVMLTLLLSASCAAENKNSDTASGQESSFESDSENTAEMRGIWVSYSELSDAFDGDFHSEIEKMFDNIKSLGLNTVFVHVRPFCDAFYKSRLFPWSAYITGTEGVAPDFDPLQFMVDEAHGRGLEIHAWINPYRISYSTENPNDLAKSSYVRQYMSAHPDSSFAVDCNGGLYLNPANRDAEKLIIDGVKEILDVYEVDGIHFDDYFYPTTDEDFDESDYAAYIAANSTPLSLADWRRENVNRMLKSVYETVKAYGEDIAFGVSPAGNNDLNYNELYADTEAWVKGGYIDYLIPQLYFGFNYDIDRFKYDNLVYEWSRCRDEVTLYVGLGAYKIGAGTEAEKADWASGGLLAKQIEYSRWYKYDGFVVFSYSSLFSDDELNTSERNKVSQMIGEQ